MKKLLGGLLVLSIIGLTCPTISNAQLESYRPRLTPVTIPAPIGPISSSSPHKNVVLPSTNISGLVSEPGYASWRIRAAGGFAGSGTAISSRLICTNNHVIDSSLGNRWCKVQSDILGKELYAYIIRNHPGKDIALLLLNEDVPYVNVSPDPMTKEDKLFMYGYTMAGALQTNILPGRYMGDIGFARGRYRSRKTDIVSISGDSGGGIFDEKGELVSINWGSTNGYSISVGCEELHGEIEDLHTQWGCPGGSCGPYRRPAPRPRQPQGGRGGPQPKQPFVPKPAPVDPQPAPEPQTPEPPASPEEPEGGCECPEDGGCACDIEEIVLRIQKLEAGDESLGRELELLKKALADLDKKLENNTLADQLLVLEIQSLRSEILKIQSKTGELEAHLKGRMHLKFAVDPESGRVRLLSTNKE